MGGTELLLLGPPAILVVDVVSVVGMMQLLCQVERGDVYKCAAILLPTRMSNKGF